MTEADNSITTKQLTTLVLIGWVILDLFAAGFLWLVYHVRVAGDRGRGRISCLCPLLAISLPGCEQCLCRIFCCKIRKRQVEACLALGNRRFCFNPPVDHWFTRPVITSISKSEP